MTDRDLNRLSRKDLLELLLAQGREKEALEAELDKAKKSLEERRIQIEQSGSIAEAALRINRVFEAAQEASEQYLENIRKLSEKQEVSCAKQEEDTRIRCERMEMETRQRCEVMEADARRRSEALEAEAKEKAKAYWEDVSHRLEAFYQEHEELRRLLTIGREE